MMLFFNIFRPILVEWILKGTTINAACRYSHKVPHESERIIPLPKNKNRISYAKTTLLWPVFLSTANEVPMFGHVDVWQGIWQCTYAKLAPLTPHPLARDLHKGPPSGHHLWSCRLRYFTRQHFYWFCAEISLRNMGITPNNNKI